MQSAARPRQSPARPSQPPPAQSASSTSGASSSSQSATRESLDEFHDRAFASIESALRLDEGGEQTRTCIIMYEEGLRALSQGLAAFPQSQTLSSAQQAKRSKMAKTKEHIESRLTALRATESTSSSSSSSSSASRVAPPRPDRGREPSAPPAENEVSAAAGPAVGVSASVPPQFENVSTLPSYEQAITSRQVDVAMQDLGDELFSGSGAATSGDLDAIADADELLDLANAVKMVRITPDGHVSAPTRAQSLKIVQFREHETEVDEPAPSGAASRRTRGEANNNENLERPDAFLQISDWVYPLVRRSSPILFSEENESYLMPDLQSGVPGSSVALTFVESVPRASRELFDVIISQLSVFQRSSDVERAARDASLDLPLPPTEAPGEMIRRDGEQVPVRPAPPRSVQQQQPPAQHFEGGQPVATEHFSQKLSRGLVLGAEWLGIGLAKGAQLTGSAMRYGSEKARERLRQNANPAKVDPRVERGLEVARVGTHAAVKVSGYVVDKVGVLTMALGRELARSARPHIEKRLPKSLTDKSKSADGHTNLDGIVEVAAASLQGLGLLFLSLNDAARVLGRTAAVESAAIVGHKYGDDAGRATENAVMSVVNTGLTVNNVRNLGVKAVAKRAVKDTGKEIVKDMSHNPPKGKNEAKYAPEDEESDPTPSSSAPSSSSMQPAAPAAARPSRPAAPPTKGVKAPAYPNLS